MDFKKALLIANPCSGVDRKRLDAEDIAKHLSDTGFDFTVHSTSAPGDATKIVEEFGPGNDVLVCCGGDGTLNEVINGLLKLDKKPTIGYIPLGSTNDLASTLGIDVGIGSATDMILSGKTNTFDVGLFEDKYFNYIASFGIASDLSYATPQKLKNIFGHDAYVIYAIFVRFFPMVLEFKPTRMKIEFNGETIEDDIYFGAISNTTSVAGVFKYDDIKLNDGYFELLLIKNLKRKTDMFGILDKIIKKDYSGDNIVFAKTKHIKITSEEKIPWTLDGEYGGKHGDVEISVIHNAYEIFSDKADLFVDKND